MLTFNEQRVKIQEKGREFKMTRDRKIREIIADNIFIYRKKSNLTQKELAEMLKVKNSAISNWETGVNSIDMETLMKLCEVLNVSISTMFGEENKKETPCFDGTEKKLIESFNVLNEDGKRKVVEYIDDLTESEKYTKKRNTQRLRA